MFWGVSNVRLTCYLTSVTFIGPITEQSCFFRGVWRKARGCQNRAINWNKCGLPVQFGIAPQGVGKETCAAVGYKSRIMDDRFERADDSGTGLPGDATADMIIIRLWMSTSFDAAAPLLKQHRGSAPSFSRFHLQSSNSSWSVSNSTQLFRTWSSSTKWLINPPTDSPESSSPPTHRLRHDACQSNTSQAKQFRAETRRQLVKSPSPRGLTGKPSEMATRRGAATTYTIHLHHISSGTAFSSPPSCPKTDLKTARVRY